MLRTLGERLSEATVSTAWMPLLSPYLLLMLAPHCEKGLHLFRNKKYLKAVASFFSLHHRYCWEVSTTREHREKYALPEAGPQ